MCFILQCILKNMKYILIVLCVLSSALLYGQDTLFYKGNEKVNSKENCTYFQFDTKDKKKDLYTTKSYYKNGRKRSASSYVINEKGFNALHGKKRQWFEDGHKKQVAYYKNGQLNGKVTSHYANGKIKRRDVYKNGELVKGKCWNEQGQQVAHKPFFVKAAYAGGDDKRQRFFLDHLRYPAVARENEIQGKVILDFVIKEDGSIEGIKVVQSVHEALDLEAKRVIGTMPKWIPASEDDEPVRSYFQIPIQFRLQ